MIYRRTAVVPVYEDNDHHPLRAKTIDENGRMSHGLITGARTMQSAFRENWMNSCYIVVMTMIIHCISIRIHIRSIRRWNAVVYVRV